MGQTSNFEPWTEIQIVAVQLWRLGVAVILTAIWRLQVDRLHPEGRSVPTIEAATVRGWAAVLEAYERYKYGLFPLTRNSEPRLRVVDIILKTWRHDQRASTPKDEIGVTRIGFFDGGSRGNPGPGGSGSVIMEQRGDTYEMVWAAATALGSKRMTNNVAEFVGLERLLAYAMQRQWTGMHIVGDSAMILNMMTTRTPPKAKKLIAWYLRTSKLADISRVASWTHHYRRQNRMADKLANIAMDSRKSEMASRESADTDHRLLKELNSLVDGDMRQWSRQRSELREVREGGDGEEDA